ncbi:unnamed protein product [Pieris macdunnoughi]|uniref:Uncharacterized protein n=1 Tax=Pieris macdunnoughi TaxID=345717 RepID=A0A821N8P7_9NEOP|nr:unnamed protein product [Pieris macdunnoughi]
MLISCFLFNRPSPKRAQTQGAATPAEGHSTSPPPATVPRPSQSQPFVRASGDKVHFFVLKCLLSRGA